MGSGHLTDTGEERLQILREVNLVPAVPDWADFIEELQPLGRRLVLASPCCGIHGSFHALASMKVPADSVLTYDLHSGYRDCLQKHLAAGGMSLENIHLNLGKLLGDLLKVPLSTLTNLHVDLLVAGPPCPPWSNCGSKKSMTDRRAKVFLRVLAWVFVLVRCGGLLGAVLENVMGILTETNGEESVMNMFLRLLRIYIPEFCWGVNVLHAPDYRLPQNRKRVFLQGMRSCFCNKIPAPLSPFGKRPLRSALASAPNPPREVCPTIPQQENVLVIM